MGNSCVGPRIPKDGIIQMIWESQVCNAVSCGNEEKSTECKMQPHVYQVPLEQTMTTQASTKPSALQSPPEEVREVLPRLQRFEEDNKRTEHCHQELEKEANVVEFNDETRGRSKQVEYTIVSKPAEPVIRRKSRNAKSTPSIGLQMESVLEAHNGYFKEFYSLGKEIGYGRYGKTFLCVEKSSGIEYACKCIAKTKLTTMEEVNDVRKEIQIMHHLAGHPNIIQIKGAYEDPVTIFVVMELCKGGELFDKITKCGRYREKNAAQLSRTILSVVAYCSSLGVFHRDLKPENFLFINELDDSPVKTIDFGLSEFFSPGETFTQVVGSPFYVAPEVLNMCYGPKADVWSAGVIIYILLGGEPPFWAETNEETFQKVLHQNLDFSAAPWPEISESAKDLVRKLLVKDPTKRLSADEALCHPWVQVDGLAPGKPIVPATLSQSRNFSAMRKLKEMALKVVAERLSKEEIIDLKGFFKVCLDNSGSIDYEEFLAATYHLQKLEREDCLSAVFSYLDKDGSGYITEDDLQRACAELGIKDVSMENIVHEVDQENVSVIVPDKAFFTTRY